MKVPGKNELIQIGSILKSHGIEGKMKIAFKEEFTEVDMPEFFFLEIEGQHIPFRLEYLDIPYADSGFLKLEDITDEKMAGQYINTGIYIEKKYLPETWTNEDEDNLEGFSVWNRNRKIGTLITIERYSLNQLLRIDSGSDEILIPFNEDSLVEISEKNKRIVVDVPDELINLND